MFKDFFLPFLFKIYFHFFLNFMTLAASLSRFIMFLTILLVSIMRWPTSWKRTLCQCVTGMSVCKKLLCLLLRLNLVNSSCIIIFHLAGYVVELLRCVLHAFIVCCVPCIVWWSPFSFCDLVVSSTVLYEDVCLTCWSCPLHLTMWVCSSLCVGSRFGRRFLFFNYDEIHHCKLKIGGVDDPFFSKFIGFSSSCDGRHFTM